MVGIYLAIIGAIILVAADAIKKVLGARYRYEVVIWNTLSFGILLSLVAGFFTDARVYDPASLLWIPLASALLILGEITFIKSITSGDFSEVAPIRASGPIFSVILGFLAFNESPTIIALAGVAFVVIGLLKLPAHSGRKSALRSPGVLYMLASQFIGVSMALTIKLASPGISPLIFFTFMLIGELAYFSLILARERINPFVMYAHHPQQTAAMGALWGIGIVAISIAPSYTLVAYAYASGQIYMPVALVVSALILKERDAMRRALPMCVVFAGVLLVIFGA